MDYKDMESNIRKYNLFQFFGSFILMVPIIVLFWQQNGLDLRHIFILQAVFAVTMVVLQIPTGFFADIYGRKPSLVIGSIGILAAAIIYAFSYSFIGFLLAEIMWGAGVSFISGADTALVYDTLSDLGKKKDYKKVEGHAQFLSRISEGIAAIVCGFIVVWGLRTVMYLTILPYVFLVFIALAIKEPKRHAQIHEKGHVHHVYKIMRFALHKNKTIKWLMLLSAALTCGNIIAFWFFQPYFQLVGIPVVYFGLLYAALNVVAALSSKYAYLFEKKVGLRIALISLPFICAAGFFLMGKILLAVSFVFVFLFEFVRGVEMPVISDAINKIVWPEKRATVLSISSMLDRVFFAILSPFIGWFADVYTIPQALMLSGVIVLVGGTITLIMLWRHKVL